LLPLGALAVVAAEADLRNLPPAVTRPVEAAQAMGLRVMKEGGGDNRSRAAYAFRLCTKRPPTDRELKSLLKFWEEQHQYFDDRSSDALRVALASTASVPLDVNIHKVAAWAMVSRVILNLDETFTKEQPPAFSKEVRILLPRLLLLCGLSEASFHGCNSPQPPTTCRLNSN